MPYKIVVEYPDNKIREYLLSEYDNVGGGGGDAVTWKDFFTTTILDRAKREFKFLFTFPNPEQTNPTGIFWDNFDIILYFTTQSQRRPLFMSLISESHLKDDTLFNLAWCQRHYVPYTQGSDDTGWKLHDGTDLARDSRNAVAFKVVFKADLQDDNPNPNPNPNPTPEGDPEMNLDAAAMTQTLLRF